MEYYRVRKSNTTYDTETSNIKIPTYVINLPERTDRLNHILREFDDKPEFDVTIVKAIKNKISSLGFWKSIRKVIQLAVSNNDDVIVITTDDHEFTKDYSREYLFRNILEAYQQKVNLLIGGTSLFRHAIPISKNRYWIHPCQSTNFFVIYKSFYSKILNEPYDTTVNAYLKISELTSSKMALFPFISVRKTFEYSNEFSKYLDSRYKTTQMRLKKVDAALTRLNPDFN